MIRPILASSFLLTLIACAAADPSSDAVTPDEATSSSSSSGGSAHGAATSLSAQGDPAAEPAKKPGGPDAPGALPAEANAGEAGGVAAPPPITPADWMARTPGLGTKGLHQIAIPGTHDSGTYSLISVYSRPVHDAFAPDVPGDLAKAGQFAFITEPWSKAQGLTLGGQLDAGARFLDLRPCAELDGTLRICHGMYGPLLSTLLDDVAAWTSAHPREIVLLNMERFTGMDAGHHTKLRNLVTEKLGSRLLDWGKGEVSATMTLDEIWSHPDKSVVVLYDKDSERAPAYMPSSEVTGSYETAIWERDPKKASLERGYAAQQSNKMFVLSGSATPDESGRLIGFAMVPGSSHPDSLEELAAATNPVIQGWLLGEWRSRRSNIIAVDFIESSCLFQVTQALNGVRDVSFTGCHVGDTSWGTWAIGPYGRGAGSVLQCPLGKEMVNGLCYTPCREGYSSPTLFPTVCSRGCPAGYRDDGLTCFRDAKIISADNSACPGYDLCGLTFAKGCSECPSGFSNDGCTCRRNPHMITKSRYDRGAGTIPGSCPIGTEKDGALCYPVCKPGFNGVGPMCWPK